MDTDQGALAGLRPLALDHLPAYKAALAGCQRTGWQHYFPFMYCYSQRPGRQLLVEEAEGSLCVYMLLQKDDAQRLYLYFLPMPMSEAAWRHAVQRVRDFNGRRKAVVYWVDGEDIGRFEAGDGQRIIPLAHEYLYSPAAFQAMSGGRSRNFRHNLAKIRARGDTHIRAYQAADAERCRQVMDDWTALQTGKYDHIRGHSYTRVCLQVAGGFDPRDLFGLVVLVDDEIRAFGFAGEMRPGLGNLFITKSDHRIKGINYFLSYHLVTAMDGCELVNASTANGPGVEYAKESMCPVAMHPMYRLHVA
jgi:hypothetical protein